MSNGSGQLLRSLKEFSVFEAGSDAEAIKLFVLSNLYLALLFAAVAVDVFV